MVDSIIGRISGNYLVSAFIPSFGFVLLATILFEPVAPKEITQRLAFGFDPPTRGALTILALSLVLGFILYGLTIFNYKVLEGYYILGRVGFMRRRRQRAALKLRHQITLTKALLNRLNTNGKHTKQLKDKLYSLQAEYDQQYPPSIRSVMPTRFGNRLKAAESYPASRYGIDSVTVWPRLIHVIPQSYHNRIHESNNGMSFVANCLALTITLSLMCLIASLFQLVIWRYAMAEFKMLNEMQQQTLIYSSDHFSAETIRRPLYFMVVSIVPYMQNVYAQRSLLYLVCSIISLGAAIGFYYVTLPAASQYGNLIRSAYDLFRLDLLSQLRQDVPEDLVEEMETWSRISEFFSVGQELAPINMEYKHPDQDDKGSE